jgi:hypothetical protein
MSERQMVDIVTRASTSRGPAGRSGYSLTLKGALGAS